MNVQTCFVAAVVAAWATVAGAQDAPRMTVVAGGGSAGFADGTAQEARFNKPIRLAPFGDEAVLVADIFNHAVRVVSKDGRVRTLVGAPDRKGHRDGPAATAMIDSPHGVGVASDGRIAIAEAGGHALRLVTVDKTAEGGYRVSTLAGVASEKGYRDGPAAQALFNSPHAALWSPDGALYAPDIGNACLRRVANGIVDTVAGRGEDTFVYPMDIALTPDGRIIVADAGANDLRIVGEGGRLSRVSTKSPLKTPHGVAVGPDGTMYVADMGTHRVLAIDKAGDVRTMAGVAGEAGADQLHLNKPAAVLVHAGWLWIADLDNHRITAVALDATTSRRP
jgi:DNA-binding beta-propeller fold protein YncE